MTPLKRISKKHTSDLKEYNQLRYRLYEWNNENNAGRSELSGAAPTYSFALERYMLELHHVTGRSTRRELLNPFNCILLTHSEHRLAENNKYTDEELLAKVRPIRVLQGFKLEDYF